MYRPHETKGTKTVWTQQYLLMRTKGIANPKPVKALYKDLDQQIEQWTADGHEILIMMDANEVPGTKPGDLGTIFAKHGLIDLHLSRLGTENEPSTYARGSRRIDYMFATPFVHSHTKRTGSPPFGTGLFNSDHRGIFADINISAILNDTVSAIDNPNARLLNSKIVQDRKKFIAAYDQHLQAHNIYERIQKLSSMSTDELKTQQDEINLIDQTRAEGMMAAEKKSCKLRQFAWSPKLKKSILLVFLWKQTLSMCRTGIDKQKFLQKLAEATNDPSAIDNNLSIKACSKALRLAQKELKDVKKNHEILRQQFLYERQIELSDDPKQKVNKEIVQRIQRAEEKRLSHARIKAAITERITGGLTHIIVPKGHQPEDYPYEPDTVTEWEKIYDPKLIEQHLLARNKAHFSQAQGTPFTIPPLNKIGHAAESEEAEQILRGEIPESFLDADEYALEILREIGKSTLPQMPIQFDTETIKQGFRKWKETTSTSPSNNHLGLWRAMTYPTITEEETEVINRMWIAHSELINFSFSTGRPLHRWGKIVNIMIEKIPGQPYLHKLRVIQIMEADYNLALKSVFGRQLLWHGEEHNAYHDAQGGSRPGRNTTDVSITQEVIYDINRRMNTDHASNENDAKACYDRMIASLMSLLNRARGMNKNWVATRASILTEARYHIKTMLGLSEDHYTHSEESPTHGSGQGAGDSSNQWGMLSSIILKIMHDTASKARFQDPYEKERKVEIANTAFVDDTSGYQNTYDKNTQTTENINQLISNLQKDFTTWDRLLYATGGLLELQKCFFYMTIWQFKDDGSTRVISPEETEVTLTIDRKDGTSVQIQQKHPNEAHKLLGIFRSPTGNQTPQADALTDKSNNYARAINSSGLLRSDTRTAYFTNYIPAMSYSLNLTSINPKILRKTQHLAKIAFLTKMGYNRNMPTAAVFGSPRYGGIGMIDLADQQGVSGCTTLLRYLNTSKSNRTADLVRINLNVIQQESGIAESILTNTRTISYLQPGWITTIRKFLQLINARITNASPPAQMCRTKDSCIMDNFLDAGLPPKILAILNRTRIYFKIVRISDIATADGRHIHPYWLATTPGDDIPCTRDDNLWPRQELTAEMWNTWNKHVKSVLLDANGKLQTTLGQWTTFPKDIFFRSFYNITKDSVVSLTPEGWQVYKTTQRNRRNWNLAPVGEPTELPDQCHENDSCVPVEVTLPQHTQRTTKCTVPRIRKTKTPVPPQNFLEFLIHQNTDTQFLVNDIELLTSEERIIDLCKEHKNGVIASDGGYQNGIGSFGWILAINGETIGKAKGPAEGDSACMSSFRSESYGMFSATTFITGMNKYLDTPLEFEWQFYLDNDALIKRIATHERKIHPFNLPLSTDYDITRAIHDRLQPLKYKIAHVKSHQDDKVPFAALSKPAQYNVLADELATAKLNTMTKPKNITTKIDKTAILEINGKTVTRKMNHALLEAARLQRQIPFFTGKFKWTRTTFHDIDWDVHQAALKHFPPNEQIRLNKFLLLWLPTGDRRNRESNNTYPAECTLCKVAIETNSHILGCTHPEQCTHMLNLHIDLEKLHHDMKSDRHLHDLIQSGIIQCALDPNYTPEAHLHHESVQHLVPKQQRIGWHHILYGRISKSITQHQEKIYRTNKENDRVFTGKRWATKLIVTTWKTVLKIWKTRCELVHGRDTITRQQHSQHTLRKRVTACYEFLPQVPANDRHMFDSSAAETLDKNPQQIETWLYMVETLIRQIKKEHQKPKNQKPISDYFKKPSHNIHVREVHSKPMKNQQITTFFTKQTGNR